jgi:hypothetical protein
VFEPMTVHVEVWPVAADEIGLWLVSGDDCWRVTEFGEPVGALVGVEPKPVGVEESETKTADQGAPRSTPPSAQERPGVPGST